jgi:hypothetical protein
MTRSYRNAIFGAITIAGPIEINADCQALIATPKTQVSQLLPATRLPHP